MSSSPLYLCPPKGKDSIDTQISILFYFLGLKRLFLIIFNQMTVIESSLIGLGYYLRFKKMINVSIFRILNQKNVILRKFLT